MVTQHEDEWVLLSYRIPREPSTPRITVWRKLKELGVAQIGDGLVALPNNPRTKEHLEWIAVAVEEAEGEAMVWVATPAIRRQGRELSVEMSTARTAEYRVLLDEVEAAETTEAPSAPGIAGAGADISKRTVNRWRRQWRRIDRRDYFQATLRDKSRLAIAASAQSIDIEAVSQ